MKDYYYQSSFGKIENFYQFDGKINFYNYFLYFMLFIILHYTTAKGIKIIGKIAIISSIVPFILLTILMIRYIYFTI